MIPRLFLGNSIFQSSIVSKAGWWTLACTHQVATYISKCVLQDKELNFSKQGTSMYMAEKLHNAIVNFFMQWDKTCIKYLRETFLERLWDFPINNMQHLFHLITNHITPRFIRKETENVWGRREVFKQLLQLYFSNTRFRTG